MATTAKGLGEITWSAANGRLGKWLEVAGCALRTACIGHSSVLQGVEGLDGLAHYEQTRSLL